ncbi:hypothetical protein NX059_012149 [Plenodomus lindquistii]|nr:hypothetical protein NX059_012149 [Plenodomus lindquistii]
MSAELLPLNDQNRALAYSGGGDDSGNDGDEDRPGPSTPRKAHYKEPEADLQDLLLQLFELFKAGNDHRIKSKDDVLRLQRVISIPILDSTTSKYVTAAGTFYSYDGAYNHAGRVQRNPDFRDGRLPSFLSLANLNKPYNTFNSANFPWWRILFLIYHTAAGSVPNEAGCQHCRNLSGPMASCRQLTDDDGNLRFNGACANCIHHSPSRMSPNDANKCSLCYE